MARRFEVAAMLASLAALLSCHDPAATENVRPARDTMSSRADAAAGEQAHRPNTHPASDECAGVSQADVDRVEQQLKGLNRDFVVWGPEEMQALRCLRMKGK